MLFFYISSHSQLGVAVCKCWIAGGGSEIGLLHVTSFGWLGCVLFGIYFIALLYGFNQR